MHHSGTRIRPELRWQSISSGTRSLSIRTIVLLKFISVDAGPIWRGHRAAIGWGSPTYLVKRGLLMQRSQCPLMALRGREAMPAYDQSGHSKCIL